MEKKNKIVIMIMASVVCVFMFVFITSIIARIRSSKIEPEMSSAIESVENNVAVSSEMTKSIVDTSSGIDTDSDSDDIEVLKPIDCNSDFWAVKVGIAECYDHMFKKGHLTGTTYYQGDCLAHDPKEIQELAKKVKLLRSSDEDGGVVYTAILPENEWVVTIYDKKIWAIIDAQIEESGAVYNPEISIVMYYYDNSLQIEIAEE